MHYKNGRSAQVGDKVVGRDWSGNPVAGIVVQTLSTPNTCNIAVVPLANVSCSLNSAHFLHVDDALPAEPKS